jgi:RNA recognition motif-containing protein
MNQNKIYVGNLSFDTTTEDLEEHFGQYGEFEEVKLISDRETGRSKGFAFITFASQQSAQSSLVADGTEFKGRRIKVNMAREDDRSSRGGRPGSQGTKRW